MFDRTRRPSFRRRPFLRPGLCAAVLAGLLGAAGCSSPRPNRDPVGEAFPTVRGATLEERPVTLPDAYAGAPVVLLVGYVQRTQFDLDRWLLGLLQADLGVPLVEVPAIPGLVPSLASGWIDEGMRSGIPPEDWSSVVTLYGDAAGPVARFTGTETPRNARVLLLDAEGRVAWFHDRGYSAREVLELSETLAGLESAPPAAGGSSGEGAGGDGGSDAGDAGS